MVALWQQNNADPMKIKLAGLDFILHFGPKSFQRPRR